MIVNSLLQSLASRFRTHAALESMGFESDFLALNYGVRARMAIRRGKAKGLDPTAI
jgi:hypothetical protein